MVNDEPQANESMALSETASNRIIAINIIGL